MKDLDTSANPVLSLKTDDGLVEADMYSKEGRELLEALWLKQSTHFRRMYEPSWLGIPIIQLSEDIVMAQELIWKVRPDVIVETGVAHGGSLILSASILEMIGHGRVIGVDIEIRKHNRVAIEGHPMKKRIDLLEGSSVDPNIVEQVKNMCGGAERVLVLLDSNHSAEHVAKELDLYAPLVSPGSYIVAMDGAQAYVSDIPGGKSEWRDDHPLIAIENFLKKHTEFVIDDHYTRLGVSASPNGYLRRLTEEEI